MSSDSDDMTEERQDRFQYSMSMPSVTPPLGGLHGYVVSSAVFNLQNESIHNERTKKPRKSLSERNVPLLNGFRLGEMDLRRWASN